MLKYTNENELKSVGLLILSVVNIYFLINIVSKIMMGYLEKHQKVKVWVLRKINCKLLRYMVGSDFYRNATL